MLIGLLGAMPEEIDCIQGLMDRDKRQSSVVYAGRTFYQGFINGIAVVLVHSRCGKVSSAMTTSVLISVFKVDKVIFTGLAGGLSSECFIGDIVVADSLYQHDMDARPLFDHHEVPLSGVRVFNCDVNLVKACQSQVHDLIKQREDFIHRI